MEYITIKNPLDSLWQETEQIMSESFPIHELRAGTMRERVMQDPKFYPVAVREGGRTVAAIYSWDLNGLFYIEHFAVQKDLRGKGMGSAALQKFIEDKHVLLEIEPPTDLLKKRRLAFYRRLGFVQTGISFMHPSFVKETAPYPLEILTYPAVISDAEFEYFRREFDERICQYSDKKNIKMTGIQKVKHGISE